MCRSFTARSKTPRGRPDPLDEVPDGGRVHLGPDPEVLQQDRTKLDQPQRCLAPGDDGVHAGTVRIVRTDSTVSVAIECGRVAARPTVALARDQVDERCFLGLLHESLSLRCAWRRMVRVAGVYGGECRAGPRGRRDAVRYRKYTGDVPPSQEVEGPLMDKNVAVLCTTAPDSAPDASHSALRNSRLTDR